MRRSRMAASNVARSIAFSAALPGAGALRLDLAAVLADDQVADGQPQAGALAGAATREERLEDVVQHLLRHAAAGVREAQLRLRAALGQVDGQGAALVHALQ